jgi:putative two-component system response regulator
MLYGPTGQRVLVVDDESACCRLLVRLLTPEFHVDVATDGESALTTINLTPPDIVLLDVNLPGMNGIEVCRAIKRAATTRLTPVVLVTGQGGREHRLAGIDAGADDFLEKPFDTEQMKARVRSLTRLKRYTDELDSAESVILSLALTVEARDPYTEGHCERLASYAVSLGAALGLSPDDLAALSRGGFLHDVGKIGISDALLLKNGQLTRDEYERVKQHPVIGERLLGDLRSLAPVRPIVRHHHERLDGSGYPDGLRGAEIPLLAHVVSIVDAFDAMTTPRPYRRAISHREACAELRADVARGRMSRDLVEMFVAVLEGRRTSDAA